MIVGDRLLFGSYDANLYCLSRRSGKLLWKFTTDNYVHGTPLVSGGVVYVAGCDEVFRGIRLTDGQELFQFPAGGNTGASPALLGKWPSYGTFNNEVVGADLTREARRMALPRPGPAVPVLLLTGRRRRPDRDRRPGQADSLRERQDRQGASGHSPRERAWIRPR